MCGLAGAYAHNFSDPDRAMFENLLFLNVFRGEDSTGVIRINRQRKKNQDFLVYARQRTLLPSPLYLRSKDASFLDEKETIGLIGHTRAATVGSVSLKNAHPFAFPNVVGVHNGTIRRQFKGTEDFDTDSEALYKLVNDEGIESALNEVADYDTAYALVFVDKKENTLNFVRNDKRPLWFTRVYAGNTLLWSSDKKTLQYAVEYAGLDPKGIPEEADKECAKSPYWTLSENTLMSLKTGGKAKDLKLKKLDVEKRTTFTGYTEGTGYTDGHNSRFWDDEWSYEDHRSNTKSSTSKTKTDKSNKEVSGDDNTDKDPDDYFPGYQGKYHKRSDFERKLGFGCFCCQSCTDIEDDDAVDNLHWFDENSYACHECYENSPENWVKEIFEGDEGDEDV